MPAMEPTLVRRAEPRDAVAVAELQDLANAGQLSATLWRVGGRDWREVGAEQITGGTTEMALALTIVAEVSGAIAGMLNFAANETPPLADDPVGRPFAALRRALGPGLYLRAMAVRPEHRGRGIARELLDVAARAARTVEAPTMGVIVHESNARLVAHYAARGFREIAREPVVAHHAYPVGSALIGLRATLRDAS